jgi:acetamidase/formamidase
MAPCLSIDRTRIHALSGPVRVQGTGPGDLVKVDVFSTGLAG